MTISFEYILYCGCFNLFCNAWVCVYVDFVMCGRFGDMCELVFTVGLFLQPTLMHTNALNRGSVQPLRRARIPDAVFVQLFLLRMGMSRPETCRG